MNKKKLFLPIILIFIGLLTLIIIQSNKSTPDTSSENEEEIIGGFEGQTTKEETVTLGDFEILWSYPEEDGVWIYFNNDKGVRAAVIPVNNFDELDNPESYTYSLEEEYAVFAFFNQTLILKYMDKYMGIIFLDLVGEGKNAQLNYRYQEL